jgi:tRNA dimethylallyltransferase
VKKRDFEVIKICLDGDRQELFGRINRRVEYMMACGLEEEARSVYPLRHLNSLNTVGLKEMFLWFDGIFTKEEAVAKIQKNTRVYAKKQLTWYKRDEALTRMDFSDGVIANAGRILDMLVL